jgi:glycosyltransferase involved in cell wall biosynthesis
VIPAVGPNGALRVVLVTMAYPHPRAGFWPGIERHAQGLAVALRDAGCRVTVVASFRNGGPSRENHDGIDIVRVPDASLRLGKLAYLFSFHIVCFGRSVAARSDVLGASDAVLSFVPLPAHKNLQRSGLSVFALFTHEDRSERPLDILVHPARRWLDRGFFSYVRAVLASSEASRRVLFSRFGIAADRVEVVPLGVSPQFMPMARGSAAGILHEYAKPVNESGPQMLAVGPLIRRKGLATLLDAIAILEKSAQPFRLVVAGSGPERRSLEERAGRLGISHRVSFCGHVSDEELRELYRASDLFVFPSRREGFGLVLVEAMAAALPIVASTVPPMPEVVGDAGVFFRPDDAEDLARVLNGLLRDPSARSRIGDAAVRRVRERFTWDRTAANVLEVIDRWSHRAPGREA